MKKKSKTTMIVKVIEKRSESNPQIRTGFSVGLDEETGRPIIAKPGETYEVPISLGKRLIESGKAKEVSKTRAKTNRRSAKPNELGPTEAIINGTQVDLSALPAEALKEMAKAFQVETDGKNEDEIIKLIQDAASE